MAKPRNAQLLVESTKYKKYVVESSVTSKTRLFFINLHEVVVKQCLPDGELGEPRWICSVCDKKGQFSTLSAIVTSSAISYLRNKHRITQAAPLSSDADDHGAAETDSSANTSQTSFNRVWTYQLIRKALNSTLAYM
ncbi:hypothetical protein E4U14_004622 [Claviceps sp. LM454 group G7]|nr:hypothetical protein E4U14_004622 [Claviceps sp. LM454 group G7]